jgi:hypothetical protein
MYADNGPVMPLKSEFSGNILNKQHKIQARSNKMEGKKRFVQVPNTLGKA